ncbi:MAG TPA: M23 family metallopeptidase [Actinopolymorphaceae bacterium]|nr:M23 family metallopeptidase [Actinopolymorphaceae bacterium]
MTAVVAVSALLLGGSALLVTFKDPGRIAQLVSSEAGHLRTDQADARAAASDRASRALTYGRATTLATPEVGNAPLPTRTPKSTKKATHKPRPKPSPSPSKKKVVKPAPKPALARLADGRPNFQMPFTCGQRWRFTTYADHNPEWGKIDFFFEGGTTRGQPVRASAPGEVVKLLPEIGAVKISHGQRWYTMYNHMDPIMVKVGQKVSQGQQIGRAGSVGTGVAHVHYEQIYDSNNDGLGTSPTEIVHPIIQGTRYSLTESQEPVRASTNNC